jgi:hypothetical protein
MRLNPLGTPVTNSPIVLAPCDRLSIEHSVE